MPRGKRLADPLVGENTLGSDSDSSQSNTSSPLVPLQLTVEVSPPHTEESNEVAQINSDGQSFQVDFITDTQHRLPATASPSPYVLSPSPSLCGSRKIDVFDDHKTERGHVPRDFADPHSRKAERLVNSSSDKRFQFEASSPVKRLRTSCEEHSSQTNHHISTEAAGDQNESRENMAAISPTVTSGSDQCRRGAREDLHEQTSNDSDMNCCQDNTALCQVDNVELVDNQPASPTLSGFMTVTSRNGESVMHGLLPSLISHPHNTASLSGCVPAEGNWYQIVPTGLPAVTRDQTQTPVNTNTSSLFSLGSVSSVMTTTSTPAVSVAATASGDPLLGFLQQFAGSTPDVLRLPVNMSAAAPRFLYAPHARSGQLLLVSPVGDISSIQQSGHQTTHQLPQQQPLIQQQQQQHLQYLQLQPQPLTHQQQPPPPQPTTAQQNQCKSPLKTNQQQNTVTAFNPVLPGKLRKGGFVNQVRAIL
ncbi:hypothetical protein BaRGS_00037744 [Batillaria attramentaria]|uniref:Uncharacterized protein n=1 Tax=Batillaria attramentaria TaxID=370345 RepID=A0ABD0J899_9CAEN